MKLLDFAGSTVLVTFYYYVNEMLESYETSGYVMFRTPETYGHWGLVVKGNQESIATLFKVENELIFELYDQVLRRSLKTGKVMQVDIDFELEGKIYIINANGIKRN